MATTIAALIQMARYHLNEPAESASSFWLDDELAALLDKGARDLWRAINDNYQHYFLTVDTTHVTQDANASQLTGVPADVSIVRGIEPVDLNARPGLYYEFRDFNHADFARARSLSTQDPSIGLRVLYCISGAGAPIAAPTVLVAPVVSAQIALRLSYVPTLAVITKATAANPIPGESDNALVAWTVAYASAKQDDSREPDASWLTVYSTEKQNILTSLTPRQTEDDEVVNAFFEDLWQ